MSFHPDISVVLPVFNEADNLRPLHEDLTRVIERLGVSCEIVYCDDGSTDGSQDTLREFAAKPNVRAVLLKRNFGQTAALAAGIDNARGGTIILMDADRQNDPEDIPRLLAKLDEGHDIVCGWRRKRKDPLFTKRIPSMAANQLIAWITGVRIHDNGCTLKAFKREVLDHISLYGEMHRFITVLGHWTGAKVAEVEVTHHPRRSGISKYSLNRFFKVMLDLPVLVLLGNYITKPMHFFGAVGIAFNAVAFGCVGEVLYEKFFQGDDVSGNPFLLLAVFFALVGIQILMIGLLAEILIRVYHESQQKKTYVIQETLQTGGETPEPDL